MQSPETSKCHIAQFVGSFGAATFAAGFMFTFLGVAQSATGGVLA